MKFQLLTLFPELFPGPLGHSITGRALTNGLWSVSALNIRDFALDKHKTVDDVPFGGGAGMVMKPDVIERALLSFPTQGRKIYMSPRGTPLTQNLVKELSKEETLTILCGRYEGVDQRVLDAYDFEEISIGDYVLTGGEMAAHILMDATVRLLPGVLGNETTPDEESFSNGLLEYPHYTRPAQWVDESGTERSVPEILTSGHHGKVAEWRHKQSLDLTKARRPDLLDKK
ncbi:MAG TPA: tRNA (guanosine(37)-N1)-methyltransferase TrmD [Alphaproteobacteria bacterium]|nr:tRNA (guanosine(37)-N1)-methyltransferase TrmD [Alphaproteobacteria bacterium]HOO52302.1 tRNA (guanosine(37)-N1)-methyltransferase TrmD [Alphaproteobacteria bacterium]